MSQTKDQEIQNRIITAIREGSKKALREFDDNTLHAAEINNNLLKNIVKNNADCEFGKKWNFSEINDVETFKKNVPFTTYEDYEEAIERMVEESQTNIITSEPIVYYSESSGTTGKAKKVPVSQKNVQVFGKYNSTIMPAVISEFYRNTRGHDTPKGIRLTLLNFRKRKLKNNVECGPISSAVFSEDTLNKMKYIMSTPSVVMFTRDGIDSFYFHIFYSISRKDVVYFSSSYISIIRDFINYLKKNWRMIVEDIKNGRFNDSVRVPAELKEKLEKDLKPNPERAAELEKIFSKGFGEGVLKEVWPDLSCLCVIWAGNFSSIAWEVRKYTGNQVPFYTMAYTMSEGMVGAARHPYDQCYVLLPDCCYYEFVPQHSDGAEEPEPTETLSMGEVEPGKYYELIITNQSGFYRYRIGDVVKIVGFYNDSPMLEFKYRKKNIASLAGEKFTEEHLASAISGFTDQTGIKVKDYCLYANRDAYPPRYEVFIEPKSDIDIEKIDEYEDVLFREMYKACTDYSVYNIGRPKLWILHKDTFKEFAKIRVEWYGVSYMQLKTIRLLENPDTISFFVSKTIN